jgi:CBS domain-containing protein
MESAYYHSIPKAIHRGGEGVEIARRGRGSGPVHASKEEWMYRYGRDDYRPAWRGRNRYDGPFYGRGYARDFAPGYMPRYSPRGYAAGERVCAADVMTRGPEALTPESTLVEAAKRMRDLDVGIIPVVDDADSYRLRGVITDRDIAVRAAAEGKDMKKARVGEYMTRDVDTVREVDRVTAVFDVMKRARVRRVPVTDDAGRLVGIIAQADLAVNYAGLDWRREAEVEEVIERISEPGGSRDSRRGRGSARGRH